MIFLRVSFELEPGAVGNTTDFKEASKKLDWGLKKVHFVSVISIFCIFYFSSSDMWEALVFSLQ